MVELSSRLTDLVAGVGEGRRFRGSTSCRRAIFFLSSSSDCSCSYSSHGDNENYSLLIRNISSSSSSRSAAAPAPARTTSPQRLNPTPTTRRSGEIPPNLHIDPRSSFAPVAMNSTVESYDDDDNNDDTNNAEQQGDDDEEEEDEIANDDFDFDDEDDERWTIPEPDDIRYAIPLPDRLHVSVHTLFGLAPEHSSSSEVGTIWLNEKIFGCNPIRVDLLKRSVNYIRNKMRGRRKAKTKTISEVSGSGRKIRQQKGTGMARAGHSRPPHFRGGAKAHGPKNTTDYGNTKLNKKVKKQAMCHALSQKLLEGNLILLNELHPLPTHKTKELAKLLEAWEIGGRYGTTALILDHYYPTNNEDADEQVQQAVKATSYRGVPINLWVASNNLYKIKVGNDLQGLNVYDVLKYEKLVLTLEALLHIEKRLENVYY